MLALMLDWVIGQASAARPKWPCSATATRWRSCLIDGNAEFTRNMGMGVDKGNLGFGERSWRYAMYVVDGEIEKMFVEKGFEDNCPDDPFEVSDADTMLAYLKSQ